MNQYEAMFLFDPTFGAVFADCEAEIRRLMDRADAEIVFLRLWDERRLAYKIKGRKRGVYVLVYFKSEPDKIGPLERDAQLSENTLRLLVLRADGVTLEMMEKIIPARGATTDAGAQVPEGSEPPGKKTEPKGESTPPDKDKDKDTVDQVDLRKPDESETHESEAPADEPATEAT